MKTSGFSGAECLDYLPLQPLKFSAKNLLQHEKLSTEKNEIVAFKCFE